MCVDFIRANRWVRVTQIRCPPEARESFPVACSRGWTNFHWGSGSGFTRTYVLTLAAAEYRVQRLLLHRVGARGARSLSASTAFLGSQGVTECLSYAWQTSGGHDAPGGSLLILAAEWVHGQLHLARGKEDRERQRERCGKCMPSTGRRERDGHAR